MSARPFVRAVGASISRLHWLHRQLTGRSPATSASCPSDRCIPGLFRNRPANCLRVAEHGIGKPAGIVLRADGLASSPDRLGQRETADEAAIEGAGELTAFGIANRPEGAQKGSGYGPQEIRRPVVALGGGKEHQWAWYPHPFGFAGEIRGG